jgi:hyperosmotically inducible periplasmic protein
MRQFAAVLILIALFVVLVGSQFRASDGDKLAAVARLTGAKLRNALPPGLNLAAPVDALRRELPTRPEDAVRARLTADKRLAGLDVTVVGDGGTVKLRGVVPDAKTRKVAVSLAENTAGVEAVVDELAVPEG